MSGYIISILGIVILGIIIDVIIPSGNINKYIKSIYAIFIVAVIVTPLVNFMKSDKDFALKYQEYEISEELLNFIYSARTDNLEKQILTRLTNEGIEGVQIDLVISTELEHLTYVSCLINTENMSTTLDKPHINSYEFITEVVSDYTGLKSEEIIISE